jgi:hypothetical protein
LTGKVLTLKEVKDIIIDIKTSASDPSPYNYNSKLGYNRYRNYKLRYKGILIIDRIDYYY